MAIRTILTLLLLSAAPTLVAGEAAAATPAAAPVEDDTVKTISHGETIDLKKELVPGKYTVFEFYAKWCMVCTQYGPQYEAAVRKRTDTVLRKIDITDAQSAVAQQFKIEALPLVMVYGPDGKIVKQGNDPRMLDDPTRPDEEESSPERTLMALLVIVAAVALAVFILVNARPRAKPQTPTA